MEWRHSNHFRRPSVNRFGPYTSILAGQSQTITILGKLGSFGVNYPLKLGWEKYMMSLHKYAWKHVVWRINDKYRITFTGSNRDWRRKINGESVFSWTHMISPLCTDDLPYPIVTKLCMVGLIYEFIKCAKFSVDRLIGVGSVRSWNFAPPLSTRHDTTTCLHYRTGKWYCCWNYTSKIQNNCQTSA
jgi:hypothetical protein